MLRSYRAADDPVVTTEWLAQRLDEVTVLDVRGHVDTAVVEPGVEKSTYLADYDAYLEGHIPVSKSGFIKAEGTTIRELCSDQPRRL